MAPNCCIEELDSGDSRWPELVAVIDEEGQAEDAFNPFFSRFPRRFVAASQGGQVVGFLMFVVWEIGPHDRRHPVVERHGEPLTEAKIIAFGVKPAHRRQGIGRALQEHVLHQARALGCYQVRSVSSASRQANHQLKLSMGFAVEPMERDEPSLVFVMPLTAVPSFNRAVR
jgi:GNAT superfamily N-acetyltransferase